MSWLWIFVSSPTWPRLAVAMFYWKGDLFVHNQCSWLPSANEQCAIILGFLSFSLGSRFVDNGSLKRVCLSKSTVWYSKYKYQCQLSKQMQTHACRAPQSSQTPMRICWILLKTNSKSTENNIQNASQNQHKRFNTILSFFILSWFWADLRRLPVISDDSHRDNDVITLPYYYGVQYVPMLWYYSSDISRSCFLHAICNVCKR